MNGLVIVRDVYRRLRMPSQQALPYQTVLAAVRESVARKKLDLALSPQINLGQMSAWFTPSATDFDLSDPGLEVFLPTRIERRAVGSDWEIGEDVPIINYEVLDTSKVGAAAFYGDPMRIAFAHTLDYVTGQQYRLVYEEDFPPTFVLGQDAALPNYFQGAVAIEAAYELLTQVNDESPEWEKYLELSLKQWPALIADKREGWDKYVKMFRGRAQTPKRTFFDNRRPMFRTNYFKG